MTLFDNAQIVGTFLGFSEGGLEFHADLILPYRNDFQSVPMHGQFVLVALENDGEAVLGRITTIAAQGRLVSGAGEDYAIRQQRENRPVPEDLRDQFLKYRVDIRILGVLRRRSDDKEPVFVASHRRLPHVGAKVAFLGEELLKQVSGATADGQNAVEIGFLAFGEFVHAGQDSRVGDDQRLQIQDPAVLPRFDIRQMVSRRSFVFARAGFGKSNLVKLLFANLYGGNSVPVVQQRNGSETPVGTVIFDPDGEYYWPDVKGRPGLCDVPELQDASRSSPTGKRRATSTSPSSSTRSNWTSGNWTQPRSSPWSFRLNARTTRTSSSSRASGSPTGKTRQCRLRRPGRHGPNGLL